MTQKILNILFPPKCGFCKKIDENFLCNKCKIKIDYLKKDKIIQEKNSNYDYLLYGYLYRNEIRNKIIDFKFNDKPELSDTFVKLLLNNKKICRFLKSYDIIIPVPMHRKKQILRGYNQTELIAKKLAKDLNLEYLDIIIKTKNTKPQSILDAENRKINAKDAYECLNKQRIINKKVVLFDDIYTTGSTVNECTKQLVGADKIAVLTIAKD